MSAGATVPPPMAIREKLQYVAILVYMTGLLASFVIWAIKDFSTENTNIVDIIVQQGKTLIGVISAYIAFVLGVKQS